MIWVVLIVVIAACAGGLHLYLRRVFANDDPWGEAGRGVADHYKRWKR